MAGLPDNRSLLSFLSLLNGGNKDSLGDSTYLDSFKPTEYFANLQGGSPAMQGIYNLGNTVANIANRENNEKTRRIQQNILQNTAMFTNAFQQEIRNLDKDYAADIDASVAELYATTDPAKQEVIRKDIIGKQAAYRKAISDKVNLFRGYATQGSPWLLPNKVESVLSGAPSVVEASLGVPQPSIKSIGDTQGKGATTPKLTDADYARIISSSGARELIEQTLLKAFNSHEALQGALHMGGVDLDNSAMSATLADQLYDFFSNEENYGNKNQFFLQMADGIVQNLIAEGQPLHDTYVKLRSMGMGDEAIAQFKGYATAKLNQVLQGKNTPVAAGKYVYDKTYEAHSKEVDREFEALRQSTNDRTNATIATQTNRYAVLDDDKTANQIRRGLDKYNDYQNGDAAASIEKGSDFNQKLGRIFAREGITDSTDSSTAISSVVDDALRIIDPIWSKENIRAALNKNSGFNKKLFFDLQLLDNIGDSLQKLPSQEKWVALGKLEKAMQKARESGDINNPGIISSILNEVGLSNEIVDPAVNKAIFMAAKGVGSYDPAIYDALIKERKDLEDLRESMNSSKRRRAAQSFYSDYYLKGFTKNNSNSSTNQNISDVPFNEEETRGVLDSAGLIMNKDSTALSNWINTGSSDKKRANRQMYVNFAEALYRLSLNGNSQVQNLEELNSRIDELINDTQDPLDENELKTYKELKKLLNNPKKARAFFKNLKEMDKGIK